MTLPSPNQLLTFPPCKTISMLWLPRTTAGFSLFFCKHSVSDEWNVVAFSLKSLLETLPGILHLKRGVRNRRREKITGENFWEEFLIFPKFSRNFFSCRIFFWLFFPAPKAMKECPRKSLQWLEFTAGENYGETSLALFWVKFQFFQLLTEILKTDRTMFSE